MPSARGSISAFPASARWPRSDGSFRASERSAAEVISGPRLTASAVRLSVRQRPGRVLGRYAPRDIERVIVGGAVEAVVTGIRVKAVGAAVGCLCGRDVHGAADELQVLHRELDVAVFFVRLAD